MAVCLLCSHAVCFVELLCYKLVCDWELAKCSSISTCWL